MRPRLALTIAAVAMIGLVAGAAPAPADQLRITKPVRLTGDDLDPGRTYSAPSMAVDPADPATVVAAFAEMRTRRCGLMRSTDHGQSWKRLEASPSTTSFPFCFSTNFSVAQAHLAFGRNHILYYLLPGWDTQDRLGGAGNVSVLLGRSTDLGNSWQTAVVTNPRGKQGDDVESNRPVTSLTVDRHSGSDDVVYVGWTRSFPNRVAPNAEPVHPMVAVSTDGGRTFASPTDVGKGVFEPSGVRDEALKTVTTLAGVTTTTAVAGSRGAQPNQAVNFGGRDASLTLDRRGTVCVAWRAQTSNITPRPGNALFLSKSTDRGKTFTSTQITPWGQGVGGLPVLRWSAEGGGDGSLHVVYEATTRPEVNGERDITFQRSTDGGKTWTAPKVLNDDNPAELRGNYVPTMNVAPNGRLDVAWWDLRNDPGVNFGNDVYYTTSSDSGTTWKPNVRVTDQIIDRRVGVFGNNFDVTAPPGLASTNEVVLFGWDDTRNSKPGELGAGSQDMYTSAIQYTTVGGGVSKVAKAVFAGVLGLLAVGLILLGIALSQLRGGQPSTRKAKEREAASVS